MISIIMFITTSTIIAELPRAKRASEALWVRKIGNPSSRKNLVMTSAYERASIQALGEGRGRLEITFTVTYTGSKGMPCFLGRYFFLEKSGKHSFLSTSSPGPSPRRFSKWRIVGRRHWERLGHVVQNLQKSWRFLSRDILRSPEQNGG